MASATDKPGDSAREALRISESRYRRLFETARDGILLLNADTAQIEDVNPYLIELLGYSHVEFLGKKLWEVGAFADRAESKEMFVDLQTGGYVRYEDLPLKTKTGAEIPVEFVSNSYECEGIKIIQCNIRNISERKRAESQRAQLLAIAESSNDAILIRGPDQTILFWNAAAERLFGWSAQEAVGQSIELIVPPERTGTLRRSIEGAARGELLSPVETTHVCKDGARIPTQITFSPVRTQQGKVIAHSYTVRDMRELKRKEEALRGHAARLRELSYRLRTMEEAERRAISRELHDRIGSNLSALNLSLNIIRSQLPQESLRAVGARLQDAQKLLEETTAHVRNVMADLHPPALDDYGLAAALRTYVESISARLVIPIALQGENLAPRLPPVAEVALFRVAQEALANVVKHARAKHIEVWLAATAEWVTLTIVDDGVGFDTAHGALTQATWGLNIMRERAEAVGAEFRVESAPGKGTRVVVELARAGGNG